MKTKMQTSVIKKTLLLALILVTGSAWAKWVAVSHSVWGTSYMDPATIRKDGNLRKVWILSDLKLPEDGKMSTRSRVEYDCKEERFRLLSLSEHSGPMGSGTVLWSYDYDGDPYRWASIPPGSNAEILLKTVCAK